MDFLAWLGIAVLSIVGLIALVAIFTGSIAWKILRWFFKDLPRDTAKACARAVVRLTESAENKNILDGLLEAGRMSRANNFLDNIYDFILYFFFNLGSWSHFNWDGAVDREVVRKREICVQRNIPGWKIWAFTP